MVEQDCIRECPKTRGKDEISNEISGKGMGNWKSVLRQIRLGGFGLMLG